MIHSREISAGSNTFFIIKAFNKYICYESFFGNVVKISGQTAVGSINRITNLIPYLKNRDSTKQFKIFYVEPNEANGLISKPIPNLLRGRPNTKYEYSESNPTIKSISYNPKYDIIVRGKRMYYCIQVGEFYFLYDDDFGNPIMGDIVDKNGNTVILKSKTEKSTKSIIDSLPEGAIVYSLKVTQNGLVEGTPEMRRFNTDTVKEIFVKTEKEKTTDKTRATSIKNNLRQKKIEELSKV